jgi:F420-dependent oxidoreductase-like protein
MTRRFRFGICTDQNMTWEQTVERWRYFEALGLESAWLCDHLVQPSRPNGPYFEAWTLLAGLAAETERIRVGVLVTSNTFRHPALLARMAATVDHISEGRLEVGLGAGWYEPEHRMFGIPLPETRELVSRFGEAVQVLDLMLREDIASFDGTYYRLEGARSRPLPVQKPRPPLVLGAFGPRMLRIVARHGDTWNAFGTPEEMRERNRMLDGFCEEIGRDPETLDRSLYYWTATGGIDVWESEAAFEEVFRLYSEAGINQFIIDQPSDAQLPMLERIATGLWPRLAAGSPRPAGAEPAAPVDISRWKKPADYL